MDYNDALSIYLSRLSPQALNTYQTGQAGGEAATSFAEVLAAQANSAAGGSGGMQQALLAGLLDGSISPAEGSQLVKAVLSTLGSGEESSVATQLDSAAFSQDVMTALLDLSQSVQDDWITQYIEGLAESGSQTEGDQTMQQYYQALASMTEAQKNLLGG